MNFEIFSYGLVLTAALVFAAANKASKVAFRFTSGLLSIIYILSIRLAEFDGDIVVYARELQTKSTGLYYVKEAAYWFGSRWIFTLLNSEVATFVVLDLFVLVVLFFALRMFRAPKYSYFLILIMFPMVFGFQNIYRQLIATSLLLLGVGLIYSGKRGHFLSGGFSVLVHNPSALLIPLYLGIVRRFRWVGVVVGLSLGAALSFLSQFESNSTSGGNFSFILSSFILIIVGLLLVKASARQKPFCGLFAGLGAISVLSPMVLASATSERVSFYIIAILFPFLVIFVEERMRPRIPVRAFLIFIFSAPTFLSSARGFILY